MPREFLRDSLPWANATHTHTYMCGAGCWRGNSPSPLQGKGGRFCGQQWEPRRPDALAGGGAHWALSGVHWWASGKGLPGAETSSSEDTGCGGRLASASLSSAVRAPALPSYYPPRSKTPKSRIGGSFLLFLLTPVSASLTKEVRTHSELLANALSLFFLRRKNLER